MRLPTIAALAALSLAASVPAFADQGAGDPFPFRAPGPVVANAPARDIGTQAYQPHDGAAGRFGASDLIIGSGREGGVDSAASLPRGFATGSLPGAGTPPVSWAASGLGGLALRLHPSS